MRWLKILFRHWGPVLLITLLVMAFTLYRRSELVAEFMSYLKPSGIALARARAQLLGFTGLLGYLAIYVVVLSLGLPSLPLQLAAGAIYGLEHGFALILVGTNLGALGAFFLGRRLGRPTIEALLGHRLLAMNRKIEKGGFRFLLLLRLLPLMPFNAINYAAGVSRMKLRDYTAANAIGMVPLTFIHVYLGSAAGEIDLTHPGSWLQPRIALPLLAIFGTFFIIVFLKRRALTKRS